MRQLRFVLLWGLLCWIFVLPGLAQSNGINVQILAVDDTLYPDITATFQAMDNATGRVVALSGNQVTATLAGQNLNIQNLTRNPSSSTAVGVAIVFDLTNSQSATFLDEQKNTASTIIDNLSPADQVAIVTFDNNGANVPVPLGNDHNLALNTIDTLEIVPGPSNQFFNGVHEALVTLRDGNSQLRKAAIVMTDVTDPQGNVTANDSIAIAQQLGVPIYMIGFNVADANHLTPFTTQTGGYTYMQRELELENVSLERMAETLSELLTTEYSVSLRSTAPATDSQQSLNLTVNISGVNGQDTTSVTARRRTLNVTFPNITPGMVVSDDVTFDPVITYADNEATPQIQTAAYYFESGSITDVLNPPDSSDPTYTWDIEEVIGGLYALRLDVTDTVGNQGSGRIEIEVASPISISFVAPADDLLTPDEFAEIEPGTTIVEVAVNGTTRVNEVTLFVDDTVLATLTTAPYSFTWDTRNLAGQYVLRVEASDVQNNRAQAEQTVNVIISEGIGTITIIILVVMAALLILVFVIVARRRGKSAQPLTPVSSVPSDPTVSPPKVDTLQPKLKVLRGVADNGQQVYMLGMQRQSIGRSRQNAIRVIGEEASREHAVIYSENGQYVYQDLTQRGNSSKVNGITVQGRHILREGDRITIDQTEFLFTYN
jgi:hypothetical protein